MGGGGGGVWVSCWHDGGLRREVYGGRLVDAMGELIRRSAIENSANS